MIHLPPFSQWAGGFIHYNPSLQYYHYHHDGNDDPLYYSHYHNHNLHSNGRHLFAFMAHSETVTYIVNTDSCLIQGPTLSLDLFLPHIRPR